MHVTLLRSWTADHDLTSSWILDGLLARGHQVDLVDRPGLAPADAAQVGNELLDGWSLVDADGARRDALLALGWVAGLAAQLVVRERPVPLALRLSRPGRSGDVSVTRVERALVRSGATVLAAGPSEAEALVALGAARSRVRLVPDAVKSSDLLLHDPQAVLVTAADDQPGDVARVLRGMAAGLPAVVHDVGVLPDLVADGVSGRVVPARQSLRAAAAALAADPLARESMGMAAADRVRAALSTEVAVPALLRVLEELRARTLAST